MVISPWLFEGYAFGFIQGAITVTNLKYSTMTNNELKTLLKNATRLLNAPPHKLGSRDAQRVVHDVNEELSNREKRKLEAPKDNTTFAGLIWKKTGPHANVLFHNGQIVAKIILVANHSQTNRHVYNAIVFGKPHTSSFEYIGPARIAITEMVEKELLRGGGIARLEAEDMKPDCDDSELQE
jgi:hypothetical protein